MKPSVVIPIGVCYTFNQDLKRNAVKPSELINAAGPTFNPFAQNLMHTFPTKTSYLSNPLFIWVNMSAKCRMPPPEDQP